MSGERPALSVVVAAYRSAGVIEACLAALASQSLPDLEVIVVNSFPGDGLREIAARFPTVILIEHPTRLLPHAARNRGLEAATGKILAFTDADCRPAPDWAERCVAAVEAGHPVVCGSIMPEPAGWFARGVHLCKYSFRLSSLPAGRTTIAGTANACYRRDVFAAAGPFDGAVFSGDALLSWSASRRGFQPWFDPGVVVTHASHRGARDFWRERIARGADFCDVRAQMENWSRARLAAVWLGALVLPLMPLARGARDAIRAGWTGTFLATLPIQIAGHLAWSLGEARAAHRRLVARPR